MLEIVCEGDTHETHKPVAIPWVTNSGTPGPNQFLDQDQLVSEWETAGKGVVHRLAVPGRGRCRFQCPLCNRTVTVGEDKMMWIWRHLDAHGVPRVTLGVIESILKQ